MFFDLFMAGLGDCGLADIALSVLTTVISQNTRHDHALVDAGALALSKDLSAETKSYPGVGYGLACQAHTRTPLPFKVENVCQEQGWLTSNDPNILPGSLPIGTRLSILPNHSCLTGAGHSFYWVTEGEEVVGIWERTAGWTHFYGIS
jgi:D-serine deaminase-like pyridoxal phosphate-dependent protein